MIKGVESVSNPPPICRPPPSRSFPALLNPDYRNSSVERSQPSISLLLAARSKPYSIYEAKLSHADVFKAGLHTNISLINALIHLYAVNGFVQHAHQLFDEMPQRDVVSWTTLIDGYTKLGRMDEAGKLFDKMPDRTVVSWNVMIAGYGRDGDVENARRLFDEMPERDVVSWNSMICAYAHNKFSEEAFEIFQMSLIAETVPSKASLMSVLPAIAGLGHAFSGRSVHSLAHKLGIEVDGLISSALINMYSKCGYLEMALQVFETIPRKNTASWNPMLAGFVHNNRFEEALEVFRIMQRANIQVDYISLVIILPAIAQVGALTLGKWVHSYIERNKITMNATLGSALVNMYSKCGCIEIAWQVFTGISDKTVELFNAMITGLAIHGQGKEALELFSEMQTKNVKFDDITLAAVLNACSHAGLVDEGLSLFAAMKHEYKIPPKIQHYGCMVDLLGRAGLLAEAKELIGNMPVEPDAVVWKSLLGACKIHGDVKIGEIAARHLIEFYPNDSGAYVAMSNIYDAAGQSNNAIAVRQMMNDGRISKEPGFSSIELGGIVHEFLVGDKSHPQGEKIYNMLDEIVHELKSVGYMPKTNLVLFDIDDEGKEAALQYHSEKLAIAFGLINSIHGEPIHITKNLRMCSDCHIFTELLSKVYNRVIIVRDQHRFHHFRKGTCTCKDYW